MENNYKHRIIEKEILLNIAKKKNLQNKEQIEKDYFQDLILYNLYKKTNLLIFKGETALYKIYNLPRFSEDLDFSLLKEFDIEDTIKKTIAEIKGAEIKKTKKTKNSLFFKISFKGILTDYNTVRIDINLKNSILENFELKNYLPDYIDINPFSIRVLNLKEILAEKIHSIFARQKARDLYDLFFLLKFVKVDKNLIRNKLKNFEIKFEYNKLKSRIRNLKPIWEKELKYFILGDLPKFESVKNFVLKNLE